MAKILIVDDDNFFPDILEDMLKNLGYESRCVSNGEEALLEVIDYGPDAVLADFRMPGINGLELIGKITLISHVPVILMTGENIHREEFSDSGAAGLIGKPFRSDQLGLLLQKILA